MPATQELAKTSTPDKQDDPANAAELDRLHAKLAPLNKEAEQLGEAIKLSGNASRRLGTQCYAHVRAVKKKTVIAAMTGMIAQRSIHIFVHSLQSD